MRGRVPKPVHDRIREGSTSKLPEVVRIGRRLDEGDLAEPPVELGADGLWWWREILPVLAASGAVEMVDLPLAAQAAIAYEQVVYLQRVLRSEGMFTIGSTGQIVPHPATRMQRDASTLYERLAQSIGASAVARTRLGLAQLTALSIARDMDDTLGGSLDPEAEVVTDADVVPLPGA